MKKVVFICHGNMFRSQVSKAFYNKYNEDGSIAESYGTNVLDSGLEGLVLSEWSKLEISGLAILISEMKKYDIDISKEHCEQLKEEYLKDADKIVVMAEREYIPDWLEKYEYEYWEIENPEVYFSEEIERIVKLIKEKVLRLIELNK